MKRVEKRLWPEGFQKLVDGIKTYELRLGDFEITEGDILVLREWDPETGTYSGRELERRVGHVGRWHDEDLQMYWTQDQIRAHGLQAISLLPVNGAD
ncbi:DUF3850 domain-containing protein [Roseibium sp. RKSG952]|uniref:DUF3850 domain-containing protein n=1 Tax=Roseibium sp. RKSG952 TaxID=2529384 RepID=UPI0012BCC215|nr:DUF3850 domain-containing protein [Roseibium sp. RKSG952]MTH99805.1 DUF3850 domain-containing protein [Roseibium sp. RKSG952]